MSEQSSEQQDGCSSNSITFYLHRQYSRIYTQCVETLPNSIEDPNLRGTISTHGQQYLTLSE
jgi:hypothetical protein